MFNRKIEVLIVKKTISKYVLTAISILVCSGTVHASSFTCPCYVTQIRMYQANDTAFISFSGQRSERPTCAQSTTLLSSTLVVDTKQHPGIFSAILAAQASGKTLSTVEGTNSCDSALSSSTEVLNQIVINQ